MDTKKKIKGKQSHEEVAATQEAVVDTKVQEPEAPVTEAKEVGGPKGPEPTRYGDWERKGRCVDF
jgi:hypothetical protein